MPINFTAVYDDLTNDLDDHTGDVSATAGIGEVRLVATFPAGTRIPAPDYAPRPAGFTVRTFTGYLDSDGQLKNERGGTVGMRVWANDPVFRLDRLQYRVEADLTDYMGRPIPFDPFYFDAPTSDLTVNLVSVMPPVGQKFGRGRNAYDVTELSVNGSNQFVFEREDGFTLPPAAADFAVDVTPHKGRAVALAIALG